MSYEDDMRKLIHRDAFGVNLVRFEERIMPEKAIDLARQADAEVERLRAKLALADANYSKLGEMSYKISVELSKIKSAAGSEDPIALIEAGKRLRTELEKTKKALGMLYDKYENGDPCYSDFPECTDCIGNAISLDGDEEDEILGALGSPLVRNKQLAREAKEKKRGKATSKKSK